MAGVLGRLAVLCNCPREKTEEDWDQRQAQHSSEEIRDPIHRCTGILMRRGSRAQPESGVSENKIHIAQCGAIVVSLPNLNIQPKN